jgi:hypothetical protein
MHYLPALFYYAFQIEDIRNMYILRKNTSFSFGIHFKIWGVQPKRKWDLQRTSVGTFLRDYRDLPR